MPLGTPLLIRMPSLFAIDLDPHFAAPRRCARVAPWGAGRKPYEACATAPANYFPMNRLASASLRAMYASSIWTAHIHYLLGVVCDMNASPPERDKPGTLFDHLGPLSHITPDLIGVALTPVPVTRNASM